MQEAAPVKAKRAYNRKRNAAIAAGIENKQLEVKESDICLVLYHPCGSIAEDNRALQNYVETFGAVITAPKQTGSPYTIRFERSKAEEVQKANIAKHNKRSGADFSQEDKIGGTSIMDLGTDVRKFQKPVDPRIKGKMPLDLANF